MTNQHQTATEYHRHAAGDVVQGAAERCIDPDAGAHDVVVLTFEERRDLMVETMRDAAALAETYETVEAAVRGLRFTADSMARISFGPEGGEPR